MAIPNLGAYTKSWRDLLDLRKLQGVKAGLPLAPHGVCGPRYSRNNNDTFGVLPLRKSGSSPKKKMKKRKEKMKKMKKKRKRRKKRQRKQRKQKRKKKTTKKKKKEKKKTKKKKTKKKKNRKRKKTGKKLREKRRNGGRTGGGTDCEREPATQEGIFFLLD